MIVGASYDIQGHEPNFIFVRLDSLGKCNSYSQVVSFYCHKKITFDDNGDLIDEPNRWISELVVFIKPSSLLYPLQTNRTSEEVRFWTGDFTMLHLEPHEYKLPMDVMFLRIVLKSVDSENLQESQMSSLPVFQQNHWGKH